MRELIDTNNGLAGWDLTMEPRIDDELTAEIMDWIGRTSGEFKPSEVSQDIFGDIHNCHVLAIGQRLQMLVESGRIRHVRACVYTAEAERMEDRIIIELGDNIVALTVPEIEDDDVWGAIERYDEAYGTDLWDRLTEADVLGVNLPEYSDAPELGDVADVEYRGVRARRILDDSRYLDTWDNDGEDSESWFAVQRGITSDGWPFIARYAFPLGYEPETDDNYANHIDTVTVFCPSESDRPKEARADIRITSTGNSLILKITEQARMLGVDRGDIVSVTIRRKD